MKIIYKVHNDATGDIYNHYELENDAETACSMVREDNCCDDWQVEEIEVIEATHGR